MLSFKSVGHLDGLAGHFDVVQLRAQLQVTCVGPITPQEGSTALLQGVSDLLQVLLQRTPAASGFVWAG